MKTHEDVIDEYLGRVFAARPTILTIKKIAKVEMMQAGYAEISVTGLAWYYLINRHGFRVELNYSSKNSIVILIEFERRRSDGAVIEIKSPSGTSEGLWKVSFWNALPRGKARKYANAVARIFGLSIVNQTSDACSASECLMPKGEVLVKIGQAGARLCADAETEAKTMRRRARK